MENMFFKTTVILSFLSQKQKRTEKSNEMA